MCPGCQSKERNRALALFLREQEREGLRVLHVAPEPGIAGQLAASHTYVSVDLDPVKAMVQADITALPFEDNRFDLVLCSHVLEHVEDDRRAMRELRRVLAPDGQALVQCPVDYDRAVTFEDPTITAPEDRLRAYRQVDHVRVYGADFPDRLSAEGFNVRVVDMAASVAQDDVRRYGLKPKSAWRGDLIHVCTRVVPSAPS